MIDILTSRGLITDEEAHALPISLTVELVDARTNKSRPLPAVVFP